jgi:ADP-L-glycero-D-manno-heptose 6-epimerase
MKILVTGHKGFIGSQLANYFQHQGHDVEGFEFVENVVPNVEMYDWVIHTGAISDTTERNVDKVWQHNYEFTMRLLQVCEHLGTNIQLASTSAVYGSNTAFNEEDPVYPQTPYAWSKFLVDKFLKDNDMTEFGMLVQSFRYFNVYGPGEGHKGDQMSLVSKFQKQASQDGVIKLFKDSNNYQRDCVCVWDICRVHEQMMEQDVSGIFNVGTGTARNLQEIAEVIAKKYDAKIEYIDMPDKLKGQYQEYTCADNAKLHNTIPIRKWLTIEDYLNESTN